MGKSPKYRLVEITWDDHCSDDSWLEPEDMDKTRKLETVKSVGWLIDESPKAYVIVGCLADNGDFSCAQTIGKGLVTEIKDVRERRRAKPASSV